MEPKSVIDRPHPEKRPGEIFVHNMSVVDIDVTTRQTGFWSGRLGDSAYSIYGVPMNQQRNLTGWDTMSEGVLRPVFVQLNELASKGYTVYAPYWETHDEVKYDDALRIIPRSGVLYMPQQTRPTEPETL